LKIRIIPYRRGSESARLLAEGLTKALGYKVWRSQTPSPTKLNLNWGGHSVGIGRLSWINCPEATQVASNKLYTFKLLEKAGVSHVPYTASKEVAQGWSKEGNVVFARTTNGQGGSGIHIVQPGGEVPNQPLYTKYVKKLKEFRVHVFQGKAIDVQQKKKRNGHEGGEPLIRNHDNGWIFARENVVEPEGLRDLGVNAVNAVGLDFGAVDIIYNASQNKCYVLEVNTAPGLCETTAGSYINAIVGALNA